MAKKSINPCWRKTVNRSDAVGWDKKKGNETVSIDKPLPNHSGWRASTFKNGRMKDLRTGLTTKTQALKTVRSYMKKNCS